MKTPFHISLLTAAVAGLLGGLACTLCAADPNAAAPPPKADSAKATTAGSAATNGSPTEARPKPAKAPLTGAELYSIHCNRCHPERYPTERTGAQWKTIMLHMQVRANIPVKQAKLILQYLEDNSGR